MMLTSKGDAAKKYLAPQIKEITLELLKIIRETENDDLTSVMQKIVCTYTEQLVPVAVDICQHLVGTFAQVYVLNVIIVLNLIIHQINLIHFDTVEHLNQI